METSTSISCLKSLRSLVSSAASKEALRQVQDAAHVDHRFGTVEALYGAVYEKLTRLEQEIQDLEKK